MTIERTLCMIKPDIVSTQRIGALCDRIERSGLRIIELRMLQLERERAAAFYAEHRQRDFFAPLLDFMCSGSIVAQVLEGEDAVKRFRQLIGHTDPAQADPGTLRADFASSIDANAVHGSDSIASARREIDFFFGKTW